MTQTVIESTTQKFLDIHDITDNVLILKDGSASIVITVNAMNFGLLAEPEQDAIMYAYAGLLNSLNYPIQIVIRSQTKDVTSYLNLLKEEEDKSSDQTKKNWIARYRGFVADLIKERNVLDKKFYVVVSASSLEMGLLPPSSVLPGKNKVDLSTVERSVILEKAKEILEPRRDHLLGQLGRIGLYGHQLATQEIIQLFYLSYNPEAAEGQQITDTQSYTTPMVQASVQGGIMDNQTLTTAAPTMPAATPEPTLTPPPVMPAAPVTPDISTTPTAPAAMAPMSPVVEPTMTPPAPSVVPPMPATPVTMPSVNPMPTPTPTPLSTPAPSMTPPVTPVPVMPSAAPVISAIPSIQSPDTPTPSPVVTPSTPSATPSVSMTDTKPAAVESIIQNEIDSTLQELGGAMPTPSLPEPVSATTTTLPPIAEPMMPSAPSTPALEPTPAQASAAAPVDSLPPLPEI